MLSPVFSPEISDGMYKLCSCEIHCFKIVEFSEAVTKNNIAPVVCEINIQFYSISPVVCEINIQFYSEDRWM